MSGHRTYRSLTLLYPKSFRVRYRDDLVQHHHDLVEDRGLVGGWLRSGLDLTVTVPVYQLESIMNSRHTALVLNLVTGLLGTAGLALVLVGFPIGLVLLGVAVVIAVTQRSELARSLRETSPAQRRRRFAAAAVLAVLAAAALMVAFNDDEWGDRGAVIYNVSFLVLAIGSVGCFVVALVGRPRTHGSMTR